MSADDVIKKEADYVLHTYNRAPFVLERGEGMTVYDTEGKAYLDFASGIAVNALGQSDPDVVAAVQAQVAQLNHVCNLYHTAPHADLAEQLCRLSFADKVYFCNSGAEANEAAIKFARKYALENHGPGKTGFVVFSGAFHGRTMGSLALTPREKYQEPFRPLMPGVTLALFNDVEAAEKAIGPETCAVFVEPVQGEGGVRVADPEFLQTLREACDRHGALLVFDEVQCGMGRTGKLWGYEHFDVQPDMMTLAKALGGGFPIGAALLTDQVAAVIKPGDHASTFAGSPVVCRAAEVVLQKVSGPAMLEHVTAMGDYLIERLSELNSLHIQEIRGLGLMVGIQMDKEVLPLIEAGYEHGVLVLNAGPDVLRLLPPLIATRADIDRLTDMLGTLLVSF